MYTKDVTARSPIRALERAIGGGLGKRNVGLVLAMSGVGKTACLVQIGLDALLRGQRVLHVSNEAPVDHLRAYYDEMFHEIERTTGLYDSKAVLLEIERQRLLISHPGTALKVAKLADAASLAQGTLGQTPEVVIIEGYDFNTSSEQDLTDLRELAARLDAEVWLSVRTHRHIPVTHELGYPAPIDKFERFFDVMVLLEPADMRVQLRVLKNHNSVEAEPKSLLLDAVTFAMSEERADEVSGIHSRARFTLHSGGAAGAEATFGETAERYGIGEVTFSFEGHANRVRNRGLRILSDSELKAGDVSLRYVSHKLNRLFPQNPGVRKVLQSIWHQIKPCQQVFVIGIIQPDGTVRGGTGWGAELARRWNTECNVFDQPTNRWYRWESDKWQPTTPVIQSPMFAGTGTRHLEPNGLKAIEELFERSFGAPDNDR